MHTTGHTKRIAAVRLNAKLEPVARLIRVTPNNVCFNLPCRNLPINAAA